MKIVVKCPYCKKKLYFKSCSGNRKKSKKEKRNIQICVSLFDKCEEIHS